MLTLLIYNHIFVHLFCLFFFICLYSLFLPCVLTSISICICYLFYFTTIIFFFIYLPVFPPVSLYLFISLHSSFLLHVFTFISTSICMSYFTTILFLCISLPICSTVFLYLLICLYSSIIHVSTFISYICIFLFSYTTFISSFPLLCLPLYLSNISTSSFISPPFLYLVFPLLCLHIYLSMYMYTRSQKYPCKECPMPSGNIHTGGGVVGGKG